MYQLISRVHSVLLTKQSALSSSMWLIYLNVSPPPLHRPAFERQAATNHHKGKSHRQASGRLNRSNYPCDKSANTAATSIRHPEEDPGLCSLVNSVGGQAEGEGMWRQKTEKDFWMFEANNAQSIIWISWPPGTGDFKSILHSLNICLKLLTIIAFLYVI